MSELIVVLNKDFEYRLSYLPPNTFWLTNQNGEGMEMTKEDLWTILDKYFNDDF